MQNDLKHLKAHALALIVCLPGISLSVGATENGSPTTTFGVYEFGAGITPPPSDVGTFGVRTGYYSAKSLKNNQGNDSGGDFSLSLLSVAPFYLRMTENKIFGANYGYGAVLPLFKMNAHLRLDTPNGPLSLEANPFRMADAVIIPIILQWSVNPQLYINTSFAITTPTGDYDKNRFVSPGLNHWTYSPALNLTYIAKSGLEVSSSFQVDISSTNKATNYKNGIEYRHEFAIGQHTGPWTAGLGGFYYRQITDDSGPGLNSGNRSSAMAIGPAISFFSPGKSPFTAHIYREFGAKNRPQGYTFAVRLAF